jgi:hypothetical protein
MPALEASDAVDQKRQALARLFLVFNDRQTDQQGSTPTPTRD